jgi:hypothetical protein
MVTVGSKHRGAISRAADIAGALGIEVQQLNLVYVIPAEQLQEQLDFNSELKSLNVMQFKTTDDPVASVQALKKLLKEKGPATKKSQHR